MTSNGRIASPSSVPGVAPIKRRILVVDGDPAVLLTLKAVLEMNDFEVDGASSAREALEKMEAGPYHMVITQPGMDEAPGIEVVREAHRQPYHPAVALLTTDPPPDGDWHGHTVLIKPIGTQDLLRQIEALLVRHEDEKRLQRPPLQLLKKQASQFKGERRRKLG